jgi:hypothetical protein
MLEEPVIPRLYPQAKATTAVLAQTMGGLLDILVAGVEVLLPQGATAPHRELAEMVETGQHQAFLVHP